MPGLQELVYRTNRGVTAYSPTRSLPTRTGGGQANAGTARQILGERQPLSFAEGRPTSAFRPGMVQPTGSPMTNVATPLYGGATGSPGVQRPQSLSVLDNLLAKQQQQPQQQQQGGFLGTVVNSLPGKMIMGALDVIDRPRRLVISGVQEAVDAINGGDASFDDFVNQFNDPNFGFGDVIGDTGNIWANRVIGFVGDVLLDPTTYIMGGGIVSGIGGKFRVGAAARAGAAGLEDLVPTLGRYGTSALDDVARRRLAEEAGERVLRRGAHFKVPFMEKYLHIPGSGVIDRLVGSNVSKLRAKLAETGPFTRLRQWMAPEGLEAAYEKLITGRGNLGFTEAAELITFRNAADRVGKTVLGRLAADAAAVLGDNKSDDLNALLTQAETTGGTAINAFFDRARTILNDAGVKFDARKYYVPHIYTDAATDFLKGTDPRALAFKKAFNITGTDPEDLSPVLMERKFVPRDEPYMIGGREVSREVIDPKTGKTVTRKVWEGGKEFKIKTGTIEEMNAEFARVFPELGFKFLDDDITSIIARYSKSVYDTAGAVGGMKALLNSKGKLLRAADDDEATKLVVDAVASKHANKAAQDELKIQLNAYSKISKQIREDTLKGLSGIQGVQGVQLRGMIDELDSLLPDAKARLDGLLVQEQELSRQAGGNRHLWRVNADGTVTNIGRSSTAEPGELQKELQRHLSDLHTRYDAAERERARIARTAAIEKEAWQDARTMASRDPAFRGAQDAKNFKNWQRFQQLSRESAQLGMDIRKLEILRARLAHHEATAGVAERLLENNNFIHQVTQPETPDPFVPPSIPTVRDPYTGKEIGETRRRRTDYVDPRTGERTPRAVRLRQTVDPRTGKLAEAGWQAVTVGGNPTNIRSQHQLQRAQLLGNHPEAVQINASIENALGDVGRAEVELNRQASIHTMNIQDRHDNFQRWKTVEAELQADIERLTGVPKHSAEKGERISQLQDLQRQGGILDQSRRAYEEAKAPVDSAKETLAFHQRELDRLKTQQMQIARDLDARGIDAPPDPRVQYGPGAVPESKLPSTYAERHQAGVELPRLRRARDRWRKSQSGKKIADARAQSATLSEQLRDLDYKISRYGRPETVPKRDKTGRIIGEHTAGGSPFSIDAKGNVTLRYATSDSRLRALMHERDQVSGELDRLTRQYELAEANWDDALRREAAGEAVDLPVMERAVRDAGLQMDAAQRELDNLNMRAARWESPELGRKAKDLENLLKERQAVVKQQTKLERTLQSKAGKRSVYLDDEISRLERSISHWDVSHRDAELEARRFAQMQVAAPTARERALRGVNRAETAALSNVRTTGYRFDWEPVPLLSPAPTRPGLRVGAYDFDDRVKLERAYSVVHNRKKYPRAPDGTENTIVQNARQTIHEISQRAHPVTLADALRGETIYDAAMVGYRAIDAARLPLRPSDELIDLLAEVTPEPGGATGLIPRVKVAHEVARQMVEQHGDEFVARGALYPSHMQRIGELQAEAKRLLDSYENQPLPHIRHQLEQISADLGRWGDLMISHKALMDAGITPNDQLSTFLVERQLFKEQEVLEAQIARHVKLIRSGGQAQIEAAHALKVLGYEHKYIEEKELMDLLEKRIGGVELDNREAESLDELLRERNKDPGKIDLQQEWNRARDRAYQAKRTWQTESAKQPEFLGLMTDDVDALTFILEEGIEEVDNMLEDVNKVRNAVKVMQWPNQHKSQLAASIPHDEQYYAEAVQSQLRLKRGIEEAEAAGSEVVRYLPMRSDKMTDVTIEDAAERLRTAPDYLKPILQRKIAEAEAKQKISRVAAWREYGSHMIPVEVHIDEAKRMAGVNQEALESFRMSLDDDILSRDVLNGEAQLEMATLKQRLADMQNPPDPSTLRRMNREYNRLAKRQDRPLTADELRAIEVNKGRLGWLETGPHLPELQQQYDIAQSNLADGMAAAQAGEAIDLPPLQREVERIGEQMDAAQREVHEIQGRIGEIQGRIDQYVRMSGGNGDFMQAAISDGASFFNDMINGVVKPGAGLGAGGDQYRQYVRLLREFLGGEEGEYARGWMNTLDAYLMSPAERIKAGVGRVTEEDLADMFHDIKTVYGDTTVTDSVIQRGVMSAERKRAAAEAVGGQDITTAAELQELGEEVGEVGGEFAFDAVDIPEVKKAMLDAMVGAAKAVSKRQTEEFMEMIEILGIRFGPDIHSASAALSAMGYRMGRDVDRYDPKRLRKFVVERLSEAGYTPTSRLEDYLQHMRMRRARIETMRRGLGAQINFMHIKDPPEFFRLLSEAWGESTDQVVEQARRFEALVMPEEMAQVLNNRISQLEDDLVEAVNRGDSKAMDNIARQINELNAGRRPSPTEAPPDVAPPGAAEDVSNLAGEQQVAVDEGRANASTRMIELDEQIQQVDERLAALGRFSSDPDAISDWSGYPQPKAPTFQELIDNPNPNKPPGQYSRAEVQSTNAEVERLLDELPDDETQWTPEQRDRLAELNTQMDQAMAPRRVPEGTPNAYRSPEGNPMLGGTWGGEPFEDIQAADAAFAAHMQRDIPVQYNYTERGQIALRNSLEQQRTELIGERNTLQQGLLDQGAPSDTELKTVTEEAITPSSLEEPTMSDALEGTSPPHEMAPDEATRNMADESIIDDKDLEYDELVEELDSTRGEYQEYLDEYGSFEGAPQHVKDTMLELSARARRLTQLQKGAVRRAKAADREAAESALPHYAEYLRLRREAPKPSVSSGWSHVMMDGTPSQTVVAQMKAQPIAPNVAELDHDEVIKLLQTPGNDHIRGDLFRRLRELDPGRWRAAHPVMRLPREGMGARARWSGSMLKRGSLDEQSRNLDELVGGVTRPRQELVNRAERERAAAAGIQGEIDQITAAAAAEPARQVEREALLKEMSSYPNMADLDAREQLAMERHTERMRINEIQRGSINLEHRRAVDAYNENLTKLNMQLADVRKNIMLASDDYNSLRSRRDQIEKALTTKPDKTEDMRTLVQDLRDLNALKRTIPPLAPGETPTPETMPIADIEAMLVAAERSIGELEKVDATEELITKRLEEFAKDAGKGTIFGQVMKRVTTDGWSPYAEKIMRGPDAVVIADSLANAMKNLQNAMRQPETWNLVGKYTAFFKTYATARPGFHVRNALSAVFMNMVANVRLRNQIEAMSLWRAMMKDPDAVWKGFTDRERNAFAAVWGSGAAGQFEEVGTGTVTTGMGRAYRKIMNNAVTHWNRRTGAAVEGVARLGMALDAVDKGLTGAAVLDRIRMFHFDYTQLSRLDRTARQLIPFWTFMSRNMPLQVTQFMLKPRTYQHYRSFVRNFSEQADPLTPSYWLSQGVFTMDPNAAQEERPWYLAPDLPHLRVTEPFEQIAQGRIGAALLSNVNPLYLAPVEAFGFGKKVYTDAPIDNEYSEPTWLMDKFMPLFKMLGGTETSGSGQEVLDERYAHLLRSLLPPVNTAERMTIGLGSAESQKNLVGRQGETMARFWGAPVYRLTPELREQERTRRYFDRREQYETQADLARM